MDYLMLLSEVGELSSVGKVRTYLRKLEEKSSNPSKRTDFSNAFCFDRNRKQSAKRLRGDSDAEKDEDMLPHPEKLNHPAKNESPSQDQTKTGATNEPAAVGAPTPASAGAAQGRKRCKCKRSRCLKFYCECFAANQYCVEGDCICKDCWNTNYSWHAQAREDAIMLALEKRPDAFSDRFETVPARLACHCKKSNCLKKYCDCYAAGRYCSELCGCVACSNNETYFKGKHLLKDRFSEAGRSNTPIPRASPTPVTGGGGSGPSPSESPSASPPVASNNPQHHPNNQKSKPMMLSPGGMQAVAGTMIPPPPFRASSPLAPSRADSVIQVASPGQRQVPAHTLMHSSSPPAQYANTAVFMGPKGVPTMMATGNMAAPVAMMTSSQPGVFAGRGTGGSSTMIATALQHQAMMLMNQQNASSSSVTATMGMNRAPTSNMHNQTTISSMQPMQSLNRSPTSNMMNVNTLPYPNTTGTSSMPFSNNNNNDNA